jgi:hypothetical protein
VSKGRLTEPLRHLLDYLDVGRAELEALQVPHLVGRILVVVTPLQYGQGGEVLRLAKIKAADERHGVYSSNRGFTSLSMARCMSLLLNTAPMLSVNSQKYS